VDCSSVLSASTSAESVSVSYHSSTTSEEVNIISSSWTSWNVFFSNSDTTNCPITSCSLYESGCSTEMNDPVNMGDSTPWDMTAEKDRTAGYSQSLCVSCTNGAQTITIDDWFVTQTASPCGNILSVPSATPDATTVVYSTTTTSESIYPISTTWVSWNDFFSNTDSTNCPITGCTLKDSTCSSEVTSPVSTEADAYPCINDDSTTDNGGDTCSDWYTSSSGCGSYDDIDFTASTQCCECGGGTNDVIGVVATKNDADGYSETLCVECTNG
jgi:hypothetical protein